MSKTINDQQTHTVLLIFIILCFMNFHFLFVHFSQLSI